MTEQMTEQITDIEEQTREYDQSQYERMVIRRTVLCMSVVFLAIGIPFLIAGGIGNSHTPQSIKRMCTFESVNGTCYIKTVPTDNTTDNTTSYKTDSYRSTISCDTLLPGTNPKTHKVTIGNTLGVSEYRCYYVPSKGRLQLYKEQVTWAVVLLVIGGVFTGMGVLLGLPMILCVLCCARL